jgi:hypothetical protein
MVARAEECCPGSAKKTTSEPRAAPVRMTRVRSKATGILRSIRYWSGEEGSIRTDESLKAGPSQSFILISLENAIVDDSSLVINVQGEGHILPGFISRTSWDNFPEDVLCGQRLAGQPAKGQEILDFL